MTFIEEYQPRILARCIRDRVPGALREVIVALFEAGIEDGEQVISERTSVELARSCDVSVRAMRARLDRLRKIELDWLELRGTPSGYVGLFDIHKGIHTCATSEPHSYTQGYTHSDTHPELARELLTRTVAGDTLPDVVGINTDYDNSTSVEFTREPSQAETSAPVVGRSVEDPNLFKLDTEEIAAQMKGAEPRYIAAARLESIDFSEYPGDGTQLAAEVFGLCYSNDGACYAAARRLVKLTPTLRSTTRLTKLAERLAELMTRNTLSAVPKDPRTAVDWSGCEKWVEPRQASTLVVETDRPTDEDRRSFLDMVRGAGANFLGTHNDDLQVEPELEEVSA